MPNQFTPAFTVTYYQNQNSRHKPQNDVLEARWLHRLFLFTMKPAAWPAWKLAGSLLLLAGLVWLVWLPAGRLAVVAAAVYLAFALADWLLLWWLPRAGYSFGPVGPQLLVMTTPRLLVAVPAGLLAWLLPPAAGIWLAGAVALLQLAGTAVYLWGTLYEPFALGVTRITFPATPWPSGSAPLRLLHLGDLHVERLTRREARLLAQIEALAPDLIVITGDYLNLSYVDDPLARAEVRKLLEKLAAPYGVYAILGSPPVDPRATTPSLFDGLNIRLLRDEAAVIRLPDGRTLSLLGVDCDHHPETDGRAFQELVAQVPPDSLKVLLYHSPELMPLVQQYPVHLYLCGHTHGGQMRLPLYGAVITSSALGKQYEMGRYTGQQTTLYISRGIGLEGLSAPRMRLLCPPEMILFTLTGHNGDLSEGR